MTPEVKERIEQIRHGNVPEGYVRSKRGIIPKDWNCCRVEDFCFLKSGDTITSSRINKNGKYPCYGGNGLRGYTDNFTHDGRHVLIGRQGALCGNVKFVAGAFYASEHAVVVTTKNNSLMKYCYYLFDNMNLNQYSESSAQPGLSVEKLLRLFTAIPELPEQDRIAQILSAQDEVIELKEKLLAEKQLQKKYLMQQLLTGKKRLPGFDGEWQNCRLHQIAKRIRRKNTVGNENVLTISAQYGLINQSEFFNKEIASEDKSNYYLLNRNDFAYNKSYSSGYPFGAIKRLTRYDKGIVSPLYICFEIVGNHVYLEYMEKYFEAGLMNREIQAFAQEGARNHGLLNIAVDDFFNSKIVLPSIEEQQAIAAILTAADREIELLRQDLEQEKQKKKALMQLLLIGIVRVNA